MESALWPIQQAVFNTLSNDATLANLVTGVFDDAPENQAYPYVVIGDGTEIPFRTFGRDGSDTTITLHIWSDYGGYREALQILNQVNSLLDGQAIAVAGYDQVYLLYEQGDPMRDPGGILRHIPARYRMVVQKQ